MTKQYKVLVNTGKAETKQTIDIQQGAGDKGQPVRIKAQAGAKYELQELGRKKPVGPDYVKAKRVGKDLHILFEDESQASLIIEDYYEVMPEGYNGVIGQAENGGFYEYIPEDPRVPGLISELAQGGQAVNVALGGAGVSPVGAAVAAAGFPLLGALGLLGAVGVAALVANQDSPTKGNTGGDLSSASDSGSSSSDNLTKQNNNLVINGKGAPNSTVDVVIKDESGKVVYEGKATTDANGDYSYTVPGPLQDGKYTPFMNGAQGEPFTIDTSTRIDMTNVGKAGTTDPISGTTEPGATVKVYDASGNLMGQTTADSSGNWSLKPVNPVPAGEIRAEATDAAGNTASDKDTNSSNSASNKTALTIDPITSDNVLLASEQGVSSYTVTGKATGKFTAGDLVELTLNGKTYAATVAADGSYSVPVSMADLKADPDTKIEATVTGTNGDKASAAQDYTVEAGNTSTKTALSINPVTADNILSASESTGSIAITGKVTGKYVAGDSVTLTVNGKAFTGAAAADGSYSINVPAADLAADKDTQIDGTVTGTGGAQASALQDYGVDSSTPTPAPTPTPSAKTALHLSPITANTDNILSQMEGNSTSITVGGFASGTYAAGDMVSLVLNGRTYTALLDSNGNYSVSVLTADLKADADKTIEASVMGTGGSAATAAQTYQVETSANTGKLTALSIDPITSDNMLGSAETTGSIPVNGYVSGAFSTNDTVTLSINGKTFTGKPDNSGFFSIDVPASDLMADSDTRVEGSVTGTGGTTAKAMQDYGVDTSNASLKTALTIDPITSDNVLLASEQGVSSYAVTGKVTGSFAAGDGVAVVLNGKTYVATVAADGSYSVPVSMADLKADPDTKIEASITGTGGDKATAAQDYTVEAGNTATQTALSINPVTADNILSAAERTGSLAIKGKVTGKYAAGDTVTLTVNGKAFTGAAAAEGSYSINVPAADLAADKDTQIDGTVTGTGGTQASALQDYGVSSSNDRNFDLTPEGDTTPPTIQVERLGSGTLTRSETLRFTLSEASTDFNQADVTVTGGTLSNFTPVPTSGTAGTGYTVYTATFTPSANSTGTATIGVAAGKFSDNAGNQNLDTFSGATTAVTGQVVESNNLVSIAYNTQANPNPPADTTAPSVIVGRQGSGNLASGNTELITFTLSEGSTSFNASDVDVSGGTLSGFAPVPGSGNATSGYHQYTAVFSPAANSVGTATIGVAAGKFQDAAGNANTDTYVAGAGFEANNLVSVGYNTQQSDTTKPTIEVSRAGSGTVTASETVYFTLSEASSTFVLSDIDVTGGTLSNFAPVVTSGSAAGGYTQYTATFTPSANASGNATIGVKSSAFTDAAGNANADTYDSPAPAGATQEDNNQVVLAYNTRTNPATPDTTAPTIAITADKATLAAGQTALLSFVLSEPSSDFVQSDVQASGGTLSNWVQVSPTQYTATFTPAAGSQGVGSVTVASNAFRDAALNANADGADANNTVNFITNYGNSQADTTAPTIVVARMGSGTLTSAETLTFTLSEASTTFGQGDIDVVGGSLSNFTPVPTSGTAGSGYTQYTATFTPSANSTGTATIGVAAGKFSDNAGNANQDDYRLSGAENTNNQVSITYNTQANPNPPADTAAPTIVVARASTSSLATGNTELITFTLSENASNFTLADIDVSGGTLSGLAPVPGSGSAASGYHQYTAAFTPAANSVGTATIGVAAGKFTDGAGNANQDDYRLSGAENLNNQVVIAYNTRITDTTAPTIEVSRAGSGTVTTSETIYFTLSEASTTFGQGDMDVTGGTLSNFTPVPSSGTASAGYTQYTATFTPSAGSSGTATIGVKSGMFSDAAGNANADTYVSPAPAGATQESNNLVSLNYNTSTNPATPDTTAPTIAITADKATLAAGQSASVTFVLSEPSSDFLSTDVQVSGGTLSGWTQLNPSTYSATFTPAAGGQGTGRIYVASSAFRDAAGNANADGADANNAVDFITNYGNNGGDSTPPTIVVARTGSGTLTSSETLTFTLSEASTNFVATDIDVVGGSLSNFSPVPTSGTAGTGYTQYTATFTPTANSAGAATIGVAAGKFSDNAGNANQDDYKLSGAENTNNQVSIAYNTQANPNPPADTTAPSIVVARAGSGSLASGATETLTFTLSENSSTFTLEDIDVVGGTLSGFAPVASSGSATSGYHQYTATFTPNAGASGTATIGVASGKFTDAKGNANTDTYVAGSGFEANNLVTIGYNTTQADSTPPTIEVSRAGSGTVGATGETVYFTLSEASSTFTLADIDVTGGTVTNLVPVASSASGTGYKQYAATFTPAANANGTATIGVASGKFTDLSGNANLDTYVSPAPGGATLEANNQISLSYNTSTNPTTPDTTAPSVAVTLDKSSLSAGQTATVTFTLSESSSAFTQSDVDVTGGTLSNWAQVSASVYTATFTPTANTAGTATIGVKSGTFTDAAGNLNADTYVSPAPAGAVLETNNQVSLTYNAIPADTTPPTIIVARTNAGTTLANGANETITFTLSEASMDFDLSDVVVTGGTLGAFTPVPTSGTPGTGYTQFTASFTPAAGSSGTATVGVAAGKFSDNAGNKNADTYVAGAGFEADNQVTLAYNTVPPDTTAPKIALSRQGSGSLTAGGSDEITFVLSEASTTFSLADVDVVGGTLTNFAPVLSSGSASTGYTDYAATFTPSSNSAGLARIGVQSGKFTDASNNANLDTYVTGVAGTAVEANNVIDITYNTQLPDTTAPTIVVSRAGAGMVSTSETIYFTLSEASTTFTQSDIDVQGGSLSGFAPVASSGNATNGYTQYAAVFTPTANSSGTATVGVKSAAFADMAGNNNTDTYVSPAPSGATFETNNQVSLHFNTLVPDTTAPTIAIDRSGTGVVTSTETITFTLSEPSTNFDARDIDVSGGSLSGFAPVLTSGNASTGYTQYTATFTPTAGVVGSASVAVASGKFTDAASNTNLDTYQSGVTGTTQEANNIVEFSVNTDTTAPTVAIARASGATTQTFTGAETINITLSEASRDFASTDLVATGGSLSGFAPELASGSAATGYTRYTVTFTPTANASGSATINVASSTFSDAGGNTNRDTGTNPAPSGATFEANNLISAPFNTDTTAPTVIVTRTSGATSTVTGTESITFTFSEAINPASFALGDIDAVGGAISNLQPDPSSGTAATGYSRYSATFTPTANTSGNASVGILASKFTDMAGNANADSYALSGAENTNNLVSFQVNTSAPDTTAPTIAITRAGAGTVTGTELIYFTLSEASSTFTLADVDVSGGALSNFQQSSSNSLVYSATFTPTANASGSATISVAAGKFQDAAGNQNLDTYSGAPTAVTGQVVEGNNQLSLAYNTDTTAPTIVVGRQGSGTVTGPITVTFTLSEASSDFSLADIDVVGGALSNLQGSGTSYSATFTPTANAVGTASVGVASSKFSDAGGNFNKDTYLANVAGTTEEGVNSAGPNIVVFQFSTDTSAPTIALSRSGTTGATFTAPETITFTLSEASSDFTWNGTSGDIVVSGGTLSALTQSSSNPLVYAATFTPNANASGTASISVASNRFSDSAGNFNTDGADANNLITAPFNTVPADTTPPTVIVTRANGNTTQSFTGAESIVFTFSEAVASTSFTSTDIDAVGGAISGLQPDTSSGSASTGYTRYTATFTPSTAGTVSIGVDASRFADAAGNPNIDTYRSGVTGTTQEANNQVSATYVPPATNATATIDILAMTTDAGTSTTDFKTNDRSLAFNGSISGWVSTNGDRVMLEVYDADPTSGTFGQILTSGFTAPATDGTWSWTDSNTNRAAGLYTLKATIVSASGTTPVNTTAPSTVNGNQTNGGWDNQAFSIDTGASNTDINLGLRITTDTSNDGNVTTAELASATSFTSRATFNSSAKAGDKLTFTATNDGVALNAVTVTLTPADITNGYVDTTFAIPADSKTQIVKVNYTDLAGNVATDTQPQDSATLQLTNNTTATIDITSIVDAATSSSDTGTSATDFVTSDQTLSYKGTITGWVSTNGDRVMLQLFDSSNNQIGSNAFVTPAADGSWTWNDTTNTRAAGTYSLKATIVSASGTTALNSTAPVNGTGGGYDQQVVVIDTTAANSDISLAVQIGTDADNNAFVNTSEIGSSTTFTTRATFSNSTAKAGDKITITASNDGTALTPVTVTLSATDITNGYVDTTFAKPAEGKVQQVTARYTDLAGNVAANTVSDSATLDTTTPTIVVSRSGSGTMIGAETITFTLSEASTDFLWDHLTQTGDIVVAGGSLGQLTTTNNITYTATFTPTANTTGTASVGVQASAFKDAAGNNNADDYRSTGAENTNNQISTSFNTVLPTATITQINGDGVPLAPPTLTITDSTTANAAITGYAANSQVVRYKFDFSTSVSNFALSDISFVDSATGAAVPAGNIGALQGSGASYYVDVTMPSSGSGSVAAIVADGSYNDASKALLNGTGSSYAQGYSGSGGSFSNGAVTTNGTVSAPQSVTLANGNYVVIGTDSTTGLAYIAIKDAATGQIITTPTINNAYSVTLNQNTAGSITAMPNGGFAITYRTGRGTGDYAFEVFNSSGTSVVRHVLSGTSTTVQEGLSFSIAATQDNNIVVMYAETVSGTTNGVYKTVTYSGSSGTETSSPLVALATISPAYPSNTFNPSMVTLTDGRIVAIWQDYANNNIVYRMLNADGSTPSGSTLQTISGVVTAGVDARFFHDIKAVATAEGGFAITWAEGSALLGGNAQVNFVKVNSAGVASTAIRLDTDNNTVQDTFPDLSQLQNGQFIVVWDDRGAGTNGNFERIYHYRLVNADGTVAGPVVDVPALNIANTSQSYNTAVEALPNGNVVLINDGNQILLSLSGANQTINGSTSNDTQMGGVGNDTLAGGGGADIILAGAGNDTVVINASNIGNLTTAGKLLDGGAGVDTLRIGADASTPDLSKSTLQAKVQNFEKIDLGSDAVVNTVILNATAVQRLASQNLDGGASSNKQLIIDGTSSDLVKLSGQYNNGIQAGYWQQSSTTPTRVVGGVTYKVYTISGLSGVEVLVNNAITSANTDTAYQMASGDIVTLPNNSVIVGDLETTATGGSTGTGDGGSQQPSGTSSTTSDTSPLVQGTLSQALTGTQVLKLYRSNVTDSGSAVEVSANVTTSGTSWQFQDSGLTAGKQYRYEARIMDGSTLVDASNTYTINEANAIGPDTTAPTIVVSRSGSGTMTGAETITFTLSEASTDFALADVFYSGGTLTGFSGSGTTYTATFTPTAGSTGTAQVGVQSSAFKDAAGNFNQDDYRNSGSDDVNNQISTSFDTLPPSIQVTASSYSVTTTSNLTLTFSLSKASKDFTFADIDLISGGGTLNSGSFAPVAGTGDATNGYTQYTVTYTPGTNVDQIVKIGVASGKFSNATGTIFNSDTYVSGTGYESNNFVQLDVNTTGAPSITKINGGGQDVQWLGDANGDGLSDFVIESTNGSEAYVVYGGDKSAMSTLNLTSMSAAQGMRLFNSITTSESGTGGGHLQAGAAGDRNRDGRADVILIADADASNGGGDVVLGVYGSSNGGSVDLGNQLVNSAGKGEVIRSGYYNNAVTIGRAIGNFDFNGDGFADSFYSARGFNFQDVDGYWQNDAEMTLGGGNNVRYRFDSASADQSTYNMADASAGDVNGDGRDDLLIVRGKNTAFAQVNSEIAVLFGNTGTTTWNSAFSAHPFEGGVQSFDINNTSGIDANGFRITGLEPVTVGQNRDGIGFGGMAEVLNDVNRDGLADILISTAHGNSSDPTPGKTGHEMFVIYGKTGGASVDVNSIKTGNGQGMYIHYGTNTNVGFTGDIASAGDFNGDGYDDFLVSHEGTKQSWLIYGKAGGTANGGIELSTIGTAGTSDGFRIDGNVYNTGTVGDINGDGFGDVVYASVTDSATYILWGGQQVGSNTPNPLNGLAGDRVGTTANDTLNGTSGNNRLIGGLGDDVLTGNGGSDVIYGGAGNDTIVLNQSNLTTAGLRVDAGGGTDTIRLDASGVTLDLTTFTAKELANFEVVDITGSGNNAVKLTLLDVVEHGNYNQFNVDPLATDTRKQLMIKGDSGDTAQLGANWLSEWVQPLTNGTYTEAGRTYTVLNSVSGNLQLLIDQSIVTST